MSRKSSENESPKKAASKKIGRKDARFTVEQRLALMKRIEAGETRVALAQETGVSASYIGNLWTKYKKDGVEGITPKEGKTKKRQLTDEERVQIRRIIKGASKPSEAGLKLPIEKDYWNPDSVLFLIERELGFTPTKQHLTEVLKSWKMRSSWQNRREDAPFDKEFYDYVDSDVGKEVNRREAELLEKLGDEVPKRRRGRPPKKTAEEKKNEKESKSIDEEARHALLGDDVDAEEIDYGDIEAFHKKLQEAKASGKLRTMSGGSGPNQRTGKHRKARQHPGSKKKKKKKR